MNRPRQNHWWNIETRNLRNKKPFKQENEETIETKINNFSFISSSASKTLIYE